MTTDKIDQHYVPRGYLKRFRDPSHKFHVWNLTIDARRHTDNIGKTFSHPYFYDHPRMDELVGGRQAVENWLSKIENKTLRSLDRFLKAVVSQSEEPSLQDWENVLLFVALQLQRTPGHRALAAAVRQQTVDTLVQQVMERNGLAGAPPPNVKSDETLLHLHDLLDVDRHIEWVRGLKRHHVVVYVNRTGKPFITSDNPVAAVPDDDNGRAVYAGPRARFFVPLSPVVSLGFMGSEVAPTTPCVERLTVRAHPELVSNVNRLVALNSVNEILCVSGEFYGVEDALSAGQLSERGVEVLTRHVSSNDPSRSFLFSEVVFRAFSHKSALGALPPDAQVVVR